MRTLNELAWKYVEPIFHAKKRAWVCSPWISKSYAEKLYDLSRMGVEVRMITSDDEYNSPTYSYLSQLSPKDSEIQSTNFDVHFVKKEVVHSKIYVVDDNYAVTGAVNFTYTGLQKQTNNFTVAENQEVEPIVRDFMRLWIGFKSENVRPTQLTLKNVLPRIPYEKAVLPEIANANILETRSAKLIINPYYRIGYSLLENVRLPWYQQAAVEDKGVVIIDASNGKLLNYYQSADYATDVIIRDLNSMPPIKEAVLDSSENYDVENREWDIKVESYKAEQLTINYIKEKNRRNISYYDRSEGTKYQPYLPSDRAITILCKDLILVPIWHFQYAYQNKDFERVLLASSGETLRTSFHKGGAICEDCGKSISKGEAKQCLDCKKWLCSSEVITCSSCQRWFHKEHVNGTCSICNQIICNECLATCPVCKKEYGKNHSVNCRDCGLTLCEDCIVTSGLILKKNRCPSCDAKSKKK